MPNPTESAGEIREGQRIAKVMARAGLCSRRDAEQWIAEGRVSVNGEVLTSPALNVGDADDVRVDGTPLRAPERTRLFLFHKPRGLVTTAKDPEGRPTIFEALPQDLPRVVAVGRLDINSEGLLLLTNDGGLSRVLELPSTGWLRRYRVRAHGEVTQEQLDALRDGITIEGIDYLGIEARFERQQGSNVWLTMGLREGKNREIKRVLEHMGLSVNRLIRISFGPFELADLEDGAVVEVRTRVLRDQLGSKLARAAGVNFEAPIEAPEPPAPPPVRPTRGDRPPLRPRERPEAPERAPHRETAPQRKRKHVSVLRAEAREEAAGPRKRIARATTADRKGREVKVERVMTARPPEEARPSRRYAGAEGFGPRRPREDARREGNAAARAAGAGGKSVRQSRPRDDARPPRRDAGAQGFGERRPRDHDRLAPHGGAGREGFGARRPRDEARPPRRERDVAPRRRGATEGTGEPRPRDDARPPRHQGAGEGFGGGRRDDRPRRETESFSKRPGREDARAPRRDDRSESQRPAGARDFGARKPRDNDRSSQGGLGRGGGAPKRPRGEGAPRPSGGGKGPRRPRGP